MYFKKQAILKEENEYKIEQANKIKQETKIAEIAEKLKIKNNKQEIHEAIILMSKSILQIKDDINELKILLIQVINK